MDRKSCKWSRLLAQAQLPFVIVPEIAANNTFLRFPPKMLLQEHEPKEYSEMKRMKMLRHVKRSITFSLFPEALVYPDADAHRADAFQKAAEFRSAAFEDPADRLQPRCCCRAPQHKHDVSSLIACSRT